MVIWRFVHEFFFGGILPPKSGADFPSPCAWAAINESLPMNWIWRWWWAITSRLDYKKMAAFLLGDLSGFFSLSLGSPTPRKLAARLCGDPRREELRATINSWHQLARHMSEPSRSFIPSHTSSHDGSFIPCLHSRPWARTTPPSSFQKWWENNCLLFQATKFGGKMWRSSR